jgi:parallel beta-helix repeat protein
MFERVCPHCGIHLQSLLADMLPNGSLLRAQCYQLEYPLGRGAYGITYRARHLELESVVAIKEFYPKEHAVRHGAIGQVTVTGQQQDVYQRGLQRFIQQGRLLAQVNHHNVVRVLDLFKERGTAYLSMELVEGDTLREELASYPDNRVPEERIFRIMEQLVSGLEAVHNKRMYHLDLKPENVLITKDDTGKDRVVLVDFGAARQGFSRQSTQAFTMEYAAPEVVAGDDVGPDSDIFELATMLYEMITGQRPPSALERLLKKDTWTGDELREPWRGMLVSALKLRRSERPTNVRAWWESGVPQKSALRTAEAVARNVITRHESAATSVDFIDDDEGPAPPSVRLDDDADLESLENAIATMPDHGILELSPGTYRLESALRITCPLRIVGTAARQCEIIGTADGAVLRFEGEGPYHLSDVTVRHEGAAGFNVVEVVDAQIEFQRSRFQGARGVAGEDGASGLCMLGAAHGRVANCEFVDNVHGLSVNDTAAPSAEENRCNQNEVSGIVFNGRAQGTVRQNEACGNGRYGILIRQDAAPVLEANRCLANKVAGLYYAGYAAGTAWYNEASSNEMHGIFVTEQAGPVLDTNQCQQNRMAGIAYSGNAGGTARENDCMSNEAYGILVCEQAQPTIDANRCQINHTHGIAYIGAASGVARQNDCSFNNSDGINLADRSRVTLKSNKCCDNKGNGISFESEAEGVAWENEAAANGGSGIKVGDQAHPMLEANKSERNKMAGILYVAQAHGTASQNALTDNLHGIYIDDSAEPTLEGNRCHDNKGSGIAYFSASKGIARQNEVKGNVHGIYIDNDSAPTLEANRCMENKDSGIAYFGSAAGLARVNETTKNEAFGICLNDKSHPTLRANRCHNNAQCGIRYQDEAAGLAHQNQAFSNELHGFEILQKAQPNLEENRCHDNRNCGIVYAGSARGETRRNEIANNAHYGIWLQDAATPYIESNLVHDNKSGIVFSGNSGGTAEANEVKSNRESGMVARDHAQPSLIGNRCEHNGENGILFAGNAGGTGRANKAYHNELHGILVSEQAHPELEDNFASNNQALDIMDPSTHAKQS